MLGTPIFNNYVSHELQIAFAVSVVIPPVGKPVPDVIDCFIYESFFS